VRLFTVSDNPNLCAPRLREAATTLSAICGQRGGNSKSNKKYNETEIVN